MLEANLFKAGKKKKPWELLMHCEGPNTTQTWIDEMGHTFSAFIPSVTCDTSKKVFGNSSLNFNNSIISLNEYITIEGDYTVEAWIYKTADNGVPSCFLCGDGSPGGDRLPFLVDKGAAMAYRAGYVGFIMPGVADVSQPGGFVNNKWTHLASTREGSTYRLFVDGIKKIDFGGQPVPPLILNRLGGALNGSSPRWSGNLDEIAVAASCLYTNSFTPPVAPYLP